MALPCTVSEMIGPMHRQGRSPASCLDLLFEPFTVTNKFGTKVALTVTLSLGMVKLWLFSVNGHLTLSLFDTIRSIACSLHSGKRYCICGGIAVAAVTVPLLAGLIVMGYNVSPNFQPYQRLSLVSPSSIFLYDDSALVSSVRKWCAVCIHGNKEACVRATTKGICPNVYWWCCTQH